MRGIDTFGNAIEMVYEMSTNNHDENIPVIYMVFESLKTMSISGKVMEVLPSAQRLLVNRLKVPYSYLSRCPEDLQAENINYWIGQEAKKRDTLFCGFDGDKLREQFSPTGPRRLSLVFLNPSSVFSFLEWVLTVEFNSLTFICVISVTMWH